MTTKHAAGCSLRSGNAVSAAPAAEPASTHRQSNATMKNPPTDCPFCHGQREWGEFPVANCYFCGTSSVVRTGSGY